MTKFGITLVLPDCAFAAELQRDTIATMMQDIDQQLTDQGAPEGVEERCDLMVNNGLAISHLLARREYDHESGVADIAYSFIYAFGKSIGFDQMDIMRGLIGTCLHNRLNLNPCLGNAEYDQETMTLQQKMRDYDTDTGTDMDWGDEKPPLLH